MELVIGKLYKTPWKINYGGYVHIHSNLETPLSLEDGEIVMLLGIEEKIYSKHSGYVSDPPRTVKNYCLTLVAESGKVGNIEISDNAIKYWKRAVE